MAVVTFKIAGRPYKISCPDGQEERILMLSGELDKKADALTKAIGFIPEGQLLAMINILTMQELFQEKTRKNDSVETVQLSEKIDNLSDRVLKLANRIKKD